MYVITLTDEDVKRLKSIIRKKTTSKTIRSRCHVLLDIDEEHGKPMTHEQSAKSNGICNGNTNLNRIIQNVMYTGIIKNGDSQSQYIDELRIIDDDTFYHAQEIMRQRKQPHSSDKRLYQLVVHRRVRSGIRRNSLS